MKRLLSSFFLTGCLLSADFASKDWQFRRAVHVIGSHAISYFVLDEDIYRHSLAGLRDLRILHSGVECPFSTHALVGHREEKNVPAKMEDKAIVDGIGLQAVLDLNGSEPHNRIRIATAKRNFKQQVRVETSDDRKSWALANGDGLIFDITQADRQISDLTIGYPLSTRRYVRLTVLGWSDPADLTSVWLMRFEETQPVRDVRASFPQRAEQSADTRETTLILDKQWSGLPCDYLRLSVRGGSFSRAAALWSSEDGKQWSLVADAQVSRTTTDQHLSIDFVEQWSRYLKLVVSNGDSRPLAIEEVTLSGVRRILEFPSREEGDYWVYSGNRSAREPAYDLVELTQANGDNAEVSLGQAEPNQSYQIPNRPWTERHPHLLIVILILAVCCMGSVIVRFLVKTKLNQI